MKVYLDDERSAPSGWVLIKTVEECITLLKTGVIEALSLDHNLGYSINGKERSGYDVVLWMEEQIVTSAWTPPNIITVHSQNPVGAMRMWDGIATMGRLCIHRKENK